MILLFLRLVVSFIMSYTVYAYDIMIYDQFQCLRFAPLEGGTSLRWTLHITLTVCFQGNCMAHFHSFRVQFQHHALLYHREIVHFDLMSKSLGWVLENWSTVVFITYKFRLKMYISWRWYRLQLAAILKSEVATNTD